MSSKLITYIAVLLILSLVIVPSPLLAAYDDLLTPRERLFRDYMARQIGTVDDLMLRWQEVVDTKLSLTYGMSYAAPGTIQFPTFPGCYSTSSDWPDTVSDICVVWNTEVCRELGNIRKQAESVQEAIKKYNDGDFIGGAAGHTTGVHTIRGSLRSIDSALSKIEGMIADRVNELIKLRKAAKEAEKEAKEDLKLGDDFCFIATAAYGTPTAVEIDELRRFRDEYLRKSSPGNEFIKFYYENSPPIAKFISEHEILRVIVREGFVEPVVKIVELTENYWAE